VISRPYDGLRRGGLCVALCLMANVAQAHEILPGVGGFPSMVLHPILTLDLLLCLLAMGLLTSGQIGLSLLFGLLAATAGICIGHLIKGWILQLYGVWRLPLISAGLAGLLVAAVGTSVRPAWSLLAAWLLGMVVGIGTQADRPGAIGILEALGGGAVAAALVMLVIRLPVAYLKHPPAQVMARVLGAWIAAISLMVLALSFR